MPGLNCQHVLADRLSLFGFIQKSVQLRFGQGCVHTFRRNGFQLEHKPSPEIIKLPCTLGPFIISIFLNGLRIVPDSSLRSGCLVTGSLTYETLLPETPQQVARHYSSENCPAVATNENHFIQVLDLQPVVQGVAEPV